MKISILERTQGVMYPLSVIPEGIILWKCVLWKKLITTSKLISSTYSKIKGNCLLKALKIRGMFKTAQGIPRFNVFT